MKLLNFVKRDPYRTRRVILFLTAAFSVSFVSLVAAGCISVHAKSAKIERETSLLASDILELREAVTHTDEESARIFTALIGTRLDSFLAEKDMTALMSAISSRDVRFFKLCEEIEALYAAQRFSHHAFVTALRESCEDGGAGSLSRATSTISPNKKLPLLFVGAFDAAKSAADFCGTKNIFQKDDVCAYCKNVFLQFNPANASARVYAVAGIPGDSVLSSDECVSKAQIYAETRLGFAGTSVSEAVGKNGVCRVSLSGEEGTAAVLGVRMDSGQIVYFWFS